MIRMGQPQPRVLRLCKEVNAIMKDAVLAWSIGGLVAIVTILMLTGADSLAVAPSTIDIKGFMFAPNVLTVPVGATVTWVNHDEETHTVTSTIGAFGSSGLMNNDTFRQTFAKPGTYEYLCRLHSYMKATLVVK